MERKVEDKIVRQIEKSLSNNINDNLFITGRGYEKDNHGTDLSGSRLTDKKSIATGSLKGSSEEVYDYSPEAVMTREEYVRQAREACLRQLSSMQRSSQRTYDMMYYDEPVQDTESSNRKRARSMHLFHDSNAAMRGMKAERNPYELSSLRFLLVRTVFAMILFLSIFLIDKFNFEVGNFTPELIQDYVTGNDSLEELENLVMTWLK